MNQIVVSISLLFLFEGIFSGPGEENYSKKAPPEKFDVCSISKNPTPRNGEIVTLQGRIDFFPHKIVLRSENCPEIRIVIANTKASFLEPPVNFRTNFDKKYRQMRKLIKKAPFKKGMLTGTFIGRFDVSEFVGYITDSEGKLEKIVGFGNPDPVSRFRIVIEKVIDIYLDKSAPTLPPVVPAKPEVRRVD